MTKELLTLPYDGESTQLFADQFNKVMKAVAKKKDRLKKVRDLSASFSSKDSRAPSGSSNKQAPSFRPAAQTSQSRPAAQGQPAKCKPVASTRRRFQTIWSRGIH
jgi:hypothetical protein